MHAIKNTVKNALTILFYLGIGLSTDAVTDQEDALESSECGSPWEMIRMKLFFSHHSSQYWNHHESSLIIHIWKEEELLYHIIQDSHESVNQESVRIVRISKNHCKSLTMAWESARIIQESPRIFKNHLNCLTIIQESFIDHW